MAEVLDFSTAYPEILVLQDTRGTRAEMLAAEVGDILRSYGFRVDIRDVDSVSPEVLFDFFQVIIVSGPDSADQMPERVVRFIDQLRSGETDLSHLAYGVISESADSGSTVAGIGSTIRRLLDELGAVEVIEPHIIREDSQSNQVRSVLHWGLDCVVAFAQAFAPAETDVY